MSAEATSLKILPDLQKHTWHFYTDNAVMNAG